MTQGEARLQKSELTGESELWERVKKKKKLAVAIDKQRKAAKNDFKKI